MAVSLMDCFSPKAFNPRLSLEGKAALLDMADRAASLYILTFCRFGEANMQECDCVPFQRVGHASFRYIHSVRQMLIVAFAGLVLIGQTGATWAQADSEFGKMEFMRSCASCHGVDGKGNGPVAKSLVKPPSDLTRLSENNKGVFPISRVYAVIDGRVQVMVHGPREMPVWGDAYTRGLADRMPRDFMSKEMIDILVRVRILTLIEYLSTIQTKK
jgi:mono/diheme cytochrome c family protein